jgi:hypothetical protein
VAVHGTLDQPASLGVTIDQFGRRQWTRILEGVHLLRIIEQVRSVLARGKTIQHDRRQAFGAVRRERLVPEEAEQWPDILGIEIGA